MSAIDWFFALVFFLFILDIAHTKWAAWTEAHDEHVRRDALLDDLIYE